jgi:hypothetical protein
LSTSAASTAPTTSSPAHFAGAYTWAAVLKRAATGSFHSPLTIGGAGAASPYLTVTFQDDTELEMRHGGGPAEESTYNWATTNLMLVVITRHGTGPTAAPRFHVLEPAVSGTWVHQAADTNSTDDPGDWTAETDDELRFGNWNSSFNFWNGLMVVQALLPGTGLSDGAVEALAGGDRDDWQTAGFTHLWEFNQASTATPVTDYVGSLDQVGIVGTSVTTFDVPDTVYSFGAVQETAGGALVRPGRHRGRYPARDMDWY